MSQSNGIGDRYSSNGIERLEWQLNQMRETGGAGGGANSSTSVTAGIDASANIDAILAAIGQGSDTAAIATIIGRLTRIATALENQLEPSLIEYQTTAGGSTWFVGYIDRDPTSGALQTRSTTGSIVTTTAQRAVGSGGDLSIDSSYYRSTASSPGVASAGVLLRQIIVDRVGPPATSVISWQNVETGAILATAPTAPDKVDDEVEALIRDVNTSVQALNPLLQLNQLLQLVQPPAANNAIGTMPEQLRAIAEGVPLKLIGPFIATQPGEIPVGARGFEIVNLGVFGTGELGASGAPSPWFLPGWTLNGESIPGAIGSYSSDAHVGVPIPYDGGQLQLLVSWWEAA